MPTQCAPQSLLDLFQCWGMRKKHWSQEFTENCYTVAENRETNFIFSQLPGKIQLLELVHSYLFSEMLISGLFSWSLSHQQSNESKYPELSLLFRPFVRKFSGFSCLPHLRFFCKFTFHWNHTLCRGSLKKSTLVCFRQAHLACRQSSCRLPFSTGWQSYSQHDVAYKYRLVHLIPFFLLTYVHERSWVIDHEVGRKKTKRSKQTGEMPHCLGWGRGSVTPHTHQLSYCGFWIATNKLTDCEEDSLLN